MFCIIGLQGQGVVEASEGLSPNGNRASLLQPGVPVHTDACQLGHFCASESGRSPPASSRQSHVFRSKPSPPGAEKISELLQSLVLLLTSHSSPLSLLSAFRRGNVGVSLL